MAASRWIYENVPGPINLQIKTSDGGEYSQPLTFPTGGYIEPGVPYLTIIVPKQDGLLTAVTLAHATDFSASPVTVELSIISTEGSAKTFVSASAILNSSASKDPRGAQVTFTFDAPTPVIANKPYILNIETQGAQNLVLSGASFANETTYDWGLPFRIDGNDPFGGMYRGDLTLEVYWDDDADKLTRFLDTLNQADYIFIPTNHQYAQITRVPERYPLTTEYYRDLIGCPAGADIIQCYREAQPGQFQGKLGFKLVAVFESYPTLGPLTINDQAAEEAFTFYDHPKVLIFQKTKDFDIDKVQALLSTVDLTQAVHLLPKQIGSYKDLMLPDARLNQQRAGGTWSQLFNYNSLQNKYPVLTVLIWYLFIFILGLFAYPIARLALPGLGAIRISARAHCGIGFAGMDVVDGRVGGRAVCASHYQRGVCRCRCGRRRVVDDPQRPVQSGVEFQPQILRHCRNTFSRLLPDRPAHQTRQPRSRGIREKAASARWIFHISTRS